MSKTSRRAVLAGAATLPALAVPAVAGSLTPDPINAVIERYLAAKGDYSAAVEKQGALEKSLPFEKCRDFEGCTPDPRWIAAEIEVDDTGDEHEDALEELLTTRPTTIEGVVSLLTVLGTPEWSDEAHDEPLLATLAQSGRDELLEPAWAFLHHLRDSLKVMAVHS